MLARSDARRQDATGISPVLNFETDDLNDDHFAGNFDFPISATIGDNPLAVTMNGNYTITALNGIPLGQSLDNSTLPWLSGDNAPWLGENSATSSDGIDAASSGPIDHGQTSRLETTIAGPGTLTDYWKHRPN